MLSRRTGAPVRPYRQIVKVLREDGPIYTV
jgi:hypothetical protein